MLGGRNRFEVALDVVVILASVLRLLGGADPKRHPDLRCDARPQQSKTWELRRLPPCEEVTQ